MTAATRLAARSVLAGLLLLATGGSVLSGTTPGVVVSGTVSASDEGFIVGADVLLKGRGPGAGTHTDADGRFTFVDVAPGTYRLIATARGYGEAEAVLDVKSTSVAVDLLLPATSARR
jgi:hypothetical protein